MSQEFINESKYKFVNISSEAYREYRFTNGVVRIEQPLYLATSAGGHRLFDTQGKSHYVPNGWIQLTWEAKPGEPNFVK